MIPFGALRSVRFIRFRGRGGRGGCRSVLTRRRTGGGLRWSAVRGGRRLLLLLLLDRSRRVVREERLEGHGVRLEVIVVLLGGGRVLRWSGSTW